MHSPRGGAPGPGSFGNRARGDARTRTGRDPGRGIGHPTGSTPARRASMKRASNARSSARHKLILALNEDLSREYQAVIAYVVYSQVLKGAQYMSIAAELEKHA